MPKKLRKMLGDVFAPSVCALRAMAVENKPIPVKLKWKC